MLELELELEMLDIDGRGSSDVVGDGVGVVDDCVVAASSTPTRTIGTPGHVRRTCTHVFEWIDGASESCMSTTIENRTEQKHTITIAIAIAYLREPLVLDEKQRLARGRVVEQHKGSSVDVAHGPHRVELGAASSGVAREMHVGAVDLDRMLERRKEAIALKQQSSLCF